MAKTSKEGLYATSYEILKLLSKGLVVAVLLTSPYGGKAIAKYLAAEIKKKFNANYDQNRLAQSLRRLTQGDLLKITPQNGQEIVELTKKGRKRLLFYDLKQLTLIKPPRWDGFWRVVIFDIDEGKRHFRNALRRQMQQMDFYRLQESVFVTPYPCEKEISLIRDYYDTQDDVLIITAAKLENEALLKRIFNL
jgi:phenylacetic acid degradation operon negative regulatory protein